MDNALYIALGAAALALLFAFTRYGSIMKKDAGSEKMQDISKQVQDGAAAFLTAEYKWLAVFVAVVACAIAFLGTEADGLGQPTAIAFVAGAAASAAGSLERTSLSGTSRRGEYGSLVTSSGSPVCSCWMLK